MRRTALKRFIEQLSSSFTVIYAEGIFDELKKFGHQNNILDLEHEISEIADKIIIVLESESAFCELGAFAHKALRKKLIVVNNSQFRKSESFINMGPIAAVTEVGAPVLWYPMKVGGVGTLDGVGAIFSALKKTLRHRSPIGQEVSLSDLSDLRPKKTSLYFAHDLVLLTGPATHEEMIEVLKILFGDKNFDNFKKLLGVLRSGQLLETRSIGNKWVYSASSSDLFLRYRFDVASLMASFRTFHLTHNLDRFI